MDQGRYRDKHKEKKEGFFTQQCSQHIFIYKYNHVDHIIKDDL